MIKEVQNEAAGGIKTYLFQKIIGQIILGI